MVRLDDRERIRLVTLDRPAVLNAFNDDLYDAVRDALRDAAGRCDLAAVVLTGAGRAFSAGVDLGELAEPRRHTDGQPHGFEPFIDALSTFPKPLLAAVNGVAVGIGLTLLLHCDLVLIADGARLRAPFVSLGVTAEAGSSHLLAERVGWQEASRLLFSSAWIDAARAVDMRLAWRRVAPERLLDDTLAVAREIAAMPVPALVATKRLMLDARADALGAARARERTAWKPLLGGPANREALAAFRERRAPDFTKLPEG